MTDMPRGPHARTARDRPAAVLARLSGNRTRLRLTRGQPETGPEAGGGVMIRAIVLGALAATIVVGAVWWVRARLARQPGTQPAEPAERPAEIGRVVLLAFGQTWAKRFGSTEDDLRRALLMGTNPTLAARVGRDIGVVDLRFDGVNSSAKVNATVLVSYAGAGERSAANLTLAWDDVPRGVRAELIRGSGTVVRTWRVRERT